MRYACRIILVSTVRLGLVWVGRWDGRSKLSSSIPLAKAYGCVSLASPVAVCNRRGTHVAAHPIGALPAYADLAEFQPRRGSGEACFAPPNGSFHKVLLRRFCSIAAAYNSSPVM